MILGLSGAAGAGKDTFGYVLRDEFDFYKTAYADRLREALYTLNPLVVCNSDQYGPHDGPIAYRRLASVIDEQGWEGYKDGHYSGEIRRLIQLMGTEVGRGIAGKNVWVDATFRDMPVDKSVVVTDVRFPNEAQAIVDRGGYIVKIIRPGVDNRAHAHPSETSMNDWQFDFEITNNARTISEYEEHVRAFMDYLQNSDALFFKHYLGE